jgi:protein phosphatase
MYWEQKVEYAALSDIGMRRRNNQDSYVVQIASSREQWDERGHLFLVADGMGGHAVGELASKIAADTIPHTYHKSAAPTVEEALHSAIVAGNTAINNRGQQNRDFARMGTTCTTLVLSSRGAFLGHVGDSRGYRVRGQRIEQLTFDHSLQWELLKQGRMSPEEIFSREPRNVITRSLGPEPVVQVDIEGPHPVRPHDVYVLCSDGLSGLVSDEEIGTIAREFPPGDACQLLVDLANLRGGADNITVVIARVGAAPPGVPAASSLPDHGEADEGLGWGWLIAVFLIGVTFIFGNVLIGIERPFTGILLEGLSVLAFGGLILGWLRMRRLAFEKASLPAIVPGNPYRTAPARVTPRFVNDLATLEYSLQRSAQEEGWGIDWPEHNRWFHAAKTALTEHRDGDALRDFARAIHLLMEGIHAQRRQRDLTNRWGITKPAPRPDPPRTDHPRTDPPAPQPATEG